MKAMVLAAGLGTRLRPLTNDRPKALVEVGGRTMLEITLARLRDFGVHDVIVNVHHFGEKVVEYLKANSNFGMQVEISREDVLLDTGGGLKKAAWFFRGDEEPFILHNVDVVSTTDLNKMTELHRSKDALATLAVQDRKTSRYLLFDEGGELCGRRAGEDGTPEFFKTAEGVQALAFAGIHILSPSIFDGLSEDGAFPIIPSYLRLVAEGKKIVAFHADEYYWRDLGRPESVAKAAVEMRSLDKSNGRSST
jgi:NDP-sugar pyrophosphorylase family protein